MKTRKFKMFLIAGLISTFLCNPFTVQAAPKITLGVTERCPYICAKKEVNQGVLIDIIKAIFKKTDVKVKVRYLPMKRALAFIKSKEIDGIIGILQRNTPDLIFPDESIGQVRYLLYTAEKDDWLYSGLNSLKSRRIGVESGKSYGIFDSYIQRYAENRKLIHHIYGSDIMNRMVYLLNTDFRVRLNRHTNIRIGEPILPKLQSQFGTI